MTFLASIFLSNDIHTKYQWLKLEYNSTVPILISKRVEVSICINSNFSWYLSLLGRYSWTLLNKRWKLRILFMFWRVKFICDQHVFLSGMFCRIWGMKLRKWTKRRHWRLWFILLRVSSWLLRWEKIHLSEILLSANYCCSMFVN